MKFLEAKSLPRPAKPENKMKSGSRPDQQFLRVSNPPNTPDTDVAREAKKLGVKLEDITEGTGPNNEVTISDVRAWKRKLDADAKNKKSDGEK